MKNLRQARQVSWETTGSLLLAVVVAIAVWVAAINDSDPAIEQVLPAPVPIQYHGLTDGLQVLGTPPETAWVTLRAPQSLWEDLSAEDMTLTVDLTGLAAGEHSLPIEAASMRQPLQILSVDPASVSLQLEAPGSAAVPVRVETLGEPALGYRSGRAQFQPATVEVVGPASLVAEVVSALAEVDLSGRRENFEQSVPLVPVDAEGRIVEGVNLQTPEAQVSLPIDPLGGYRLVSVIPIIEGSLEPGYQMTEISVSPTLVTVFSAEPDAVKDLPGYVETEAISLTDRQESFDAQVSLALPEGVLLVGDETILVQVGIAPIEVTSTLTQPLAVQGLRTGLYSRIAPEFVNVILKGPLPVLDALEPDAITITVDLQGLGPGSHQVTPAVVGLPEGVILQSILPDTVEVVISMSPLATNTPVP
jgi:YbbR domain-containing protein